MKNLFFVFAVIIVVSTSCNGNSGRRQPMALEGQAGETTSFVQPVASPVRIDYKIFLESSGSMDGYVNGATFSEFKGFLFGLMNNLRNDDNTKTVNISFINGKGDYSKVEDANISQINQFITGLNAAAFHQYSGNAHTNMSDLISQILATIDSSSVSLLASDFIFSPPRGVVVPTWLNQQKEAIRGAFAEFLKSHSSTAICLYRVMSSFNGRFYNIEDRPEVINDIRPFYVLAVGDVYSIKEMMGTAPTNQIDQVFTITNGKVPVNYAANFIPGANYRITNSHSITKLRRDKRTGQAGFAFDAKLDAFLLDASYVTNVSNYEVSGGNYQIQSIAPYTNPGSYTHRINMASQFPNKANLKIKIVKNIPTWVENATDYDGTNIHNPGAMSKTFGFKTLIDGIYEAFSNGESKYYTEFDININN